MGEKITYKHLSKDFTVNVSYLAFPNLSSSNLNPKFCYYSQSSLILFEF